MKIPKRSHFIKRREFNIFRKEKEKKKKKKESKNNKKSSICEFDWLRGKI